MENEKVDFKQMQKKLVRIGIRISEAEKSQLDEFCKINGIQISDLTRYAIRQVINQKN